MYSMTEEMADQLRPNMLELSELPHQNGEVVNHLPAFGCNADGEMMLMDELKTPIETHNH